ncbi:hypothetical protein GCM10007981_03400 [Thermocladium modestius]|uniref:UspA domain-containing protein n=1 Tax=Thermocladium modestius TaxID=62609 RepID=A0A830GSD7_9CREN|nr:universal stress protein [Thermocladium modestius]GGP19493.1 hypothetical protein GCM10007981_03400 [Thermocladium modestius]
MGSSIAGNRRASGLEKIRSHMDKWLGLYVGLMIVIGLAAGYRDVGWVQHHVQALQLLEIASIYVMIFPMMLMLNVRALGSAFKNYKLVLAVVLLNFAYGPLMAVLLGGLFVANPFARFGLFIAWLVPCSSMSIGYVGLMMADISAATAMVALSFILSLAVIPLEASLYISVMVHQVRGVALTGRAVSSIEVGLFMTIIEVLLAPLVLAIPIREAMMRRMGQARFREVSPLFPTLTMLGMMMIIFIIFFAHAGVLISHIMDVLGIFYSAMVFGTVSLTVLTVLFKYVGLNKRGESRYGSAMVAILTGVPKNEATAIAISTLALSSLGPQAAFLTSMPPSLLPAFQVVFIITFLKLRDRVMKYYGERGVEVIERGRAAEMGILEAARGAMAMLVPVDFSRGTDEWVVNGLGRLSSYARIGRVRLLYVIPLGLSEVSEFITDNIISEGRKAAEAKMRELVGAVRSKVIGLGGVDLDYEIVVGDPASIILDRASAGGFDAIMMGHRGYGYVEDLFVGSVTLKVVSRSPIPVVVIRKSV